MKKCPTCQTEKPFDQFHKDRSKKDGFNLYCKPCMIAKQKEFQARPPRRVDAAGTKTCQHCKEVKTPADFYSDKGMWDGLGRVCKTCVGERHGDWRRKNLDYVASKSREWRIKNPERYRDHMLKSNYGVSLGTYDAMFAEQEGKCAICGTGDTGRHTRFHVDHCHDTGAIRGLLCHNCNHGVGHFKNSPEKLKAAGAYLKRQPPQSTTQKWK